MKIKVTEQGLVVPKELLEGIQEVEIRRENFKTLVILIKLDPVSGLGSDQIDSSVTDASENHDADLSERLLSDYAGILEDSPNFNEDPVEIQKRMRDEWR